MRISNVSHEKSRIFKFIRQVRIIQLSTYLRVRKRNDSQFYRRKYRADTRSSPPSTSRDFNKGDSLGICIPWTRSKWMLTIVTPLSRPSCRPSKSVAKRKISALAETERGEAADCTSSREGCRGSGLEAVDGRTDPGCFRKIHHTMAGSIRIPINMNYVGT